MKSILVLAAAAGAFGWMLFATFRDADLAVEAEAAALARLRTNGEEPAGAGGYRFERLDGLLVARPGESEGRRWFATTDGGRTIWEYDTVRHRVPPGGPDLDELRRWLARAEDERGRPPIGWEATRADG